MLEQMITASRQEQHRLAVLYLDIDHFKEINEKYCHEFGDILIKYFGERISYKIRINDVAARVSGDKFVVILPQLDKTETIQSIAEKLLEIFMEPFKIGDIECKLTASIGISLFPSDGNRVSELLAKADVALYKAKESGGNNYQFVTGELEKVVKARADFEQTLSQAVQNQEFILYFQPMIDVQHNNIACLETFLHWKHDQKLMDPNEFISFSEETGLIIPIGKWVLHATCEQFKKWQQFNPELSLSTEPFDFASRIKPLIIRYQSISNIPIKSFTS